MWTSANIRAALLALCWTTLAAGCRFGLDVVAADGAPDDARVADSSISDAAPDATPVTCTTGGPGLVAWYRLENPDVESGVIDSSDNGLHGVCPALCPAIITGARGNGVSFPAGGTSPIEVTTSPAFELTSGFTVALWMRTSVTPATAATLASKRVGIENNSFQMVVTSAGTYSVFTDTATARSTLTSAVNVVDGAWHHLAITWSSTGRRSIAVDNEVTANSTVVDVEFANSSVYLGIDEDDGALNNEYEGDLDEVRLYNRALTAAELSELAGCGP